MNAAPVLVRRPGPCPRCNDPRGRALAVDGGAKLLRLDCPNCGTRDVPYGGRARNHGRPPG